MGSSADSSPSTSSSSIRVLLIGLRGAGKTFVGEALAERLNLPWIDTDQWIEAHRSAPATIIHEDGVEELRRAEVAAVRDFASSPHGVISLGGGAVETPEVAGLLRGWTSFWLDAPDEELVRRIHSDLVDRPPLTSAENPLEEMAQLRERRTPLYGEFSPVMISTVVKEGSRLSRSRNRRDIVEEIVEFIAGEAATE